jgi:hypothetical protein
MMRYAALFYRFFACPPPCLAGLGTRALAGFVSVLPAIQPARSKFCSCEAVSVLPDPITPFFCISSNSCFISGSTVQVSVRFTCIVQELGRRTVLHQLRRTEHQSHRHDGHEDHRVLEERQRRDYDWSASGVGTLRIRSTYSQSAPGKSTSSLQPSTQSLAHCHPLPCSRPCYPIHSLGTSAMPSLLPSSPHYLLQPPQRSHQFAAARIDSRGSVRKRDMTLRLRLRS